MRTLTLILIVIQSQSMFVRKIDVTQGFWSVNYTQKKINSTHLLNISKKQSQKYLLLELFSQSQNIMLLQSFDEAPYILDNKMYCDNIDEDGKYFALKYHHIILEQENKQTVTTYVTILTNQTISYRFSITAFDEIPCPNKCSNNGDCIKGICRCQPNFTDIDCSQKGVQILPFLKDSQKLDLQKPNFFYTTINSSKNYLLKIKWESDQPANSSFQIRISKIGKLPSNSLNNYNVNLSSNKLMNLKFKGNQIKSQDIELMLIVKLEVQDAVNLNTLLNFEIVEKEFPDENEKIFRAGILIIFFLFVVIAIYIIIQCCFKWSNNRKWKFIHYNQIISVEEQECAICLDNFSENEQIVQLNCSHNFHFKCIELWIKINQTCPICKLHVIF